MRILKNNNNSVSRPNTSDSTEFESLYNQILRSSTKVLTRSKAQQLFRMTRRSTAEFKRDWHPTHDQLKAYYHHQFIRAFIFQFPDIFVQEFETATGSTIAEFKSVIAPCIQRYLSRACIFEHQQGWQLKPGQT